MKLDIGLADFSEPTLLIVGDSESLSWLADRVAMRQSLDLSIFPFVRLIDVSLTLQADETGALSRDGAAFIWRIALSESQRFVEQLRVLAASKVPAHAYLDAASNSSGVEIVASNGEYNSDEIFGQ